MGVYSALRVQGAKQHYIYLVVSFFHRDAIESSSKLSGATKGGDGALMTSTRKEVEDHEGKFNASAAFLSMYLKSAHTNNYKQYQAVFSTVYTLSHRTQALAKREPLSFDFQEVSFQLRYVAQRVHILSEVRHISSHGHINPRDLAWPKATASNDLEVTWSISLSLTLNEMWPLRCQLSTVSVWPELMEVWAMPYQTPWIAMVVLQTGTACQACWQMYQHALSETYEGSTNTKVQQATFSNDQTYTRLLYVHLSFSLMQDEAQVITWIMNMIMIAVFKMASMNTTPDRPERKMGSMK